MCVKKVSDSLAEAGKDIISLLKQLTLPNDGYLEEAQTYRDTYGADFVGLVVSDFAARNHCAVAWVNINFDYVYLYAAYVFLVASIWARNRTHHGLRPRPHHCT